MIERPILFSAPMVRALLDGSKTQTRRVAKLTDGAPQACTYGQPGDRLWVRESFWGCDLPGYGDRPCVVYDDEWHGKEYKPAEPRPWGRKFGRIPSIHMPRECSRITLEITGVRVERLRNITVSDAICEGYDGSNPSPVDPSIEWFSNLWESINGPGSWDLNPWVWVISFKRIEA